MGSWGNALFSQDEIIVDVTNGCSPLIVSFSYNLDDSPSFLSWDFGNSNTLSGNPATDPAILNPAFSYITPGTYTVTLSSTTTSGTTSYTFTDLITIHEAPSPNFIANIVEDCEGFEVNFTDLSTVFNSSISSWNWDFGDGGSSNEQNPDHLYTIAGEYDVSLSITDDNGCNNIFTIDEYITVIEGVDAEFELVLSDSCSLPSNLTVVNTSSGNGILDYSWNFGNGQTSIDENPPIISYTTFGEFTISLLLTSDFACVDELSQSISIEEKFVLFTSSATCLPSPTQFTNESMSSMNTFDWDFGDPSSGTENTSNLENPSHLFSSSGQYTVTLTASIEGQCENTYELIIDVLEAPEIDYEIDQSLICEVPASIPISINNSNVSSFIWNVYYSEDSELYSSGSNFSNTINFNNFTNSVLDTYYDFSLEVIFDNGCISTIEEEDFFTVDAIQLSTEVGPIELCEGEILYAADLTDYAPGIDGYEWDWGDGTPISELQSDQHEYSSGSYTLNFSLSTPAGCSKDTSILVLVGNVTDPSFSYIDTTICIEDSVQFVYTGDSTLVDSYLWLYNSLVAADVQSPNISINDIDYLHNITLITNNNGCKDTAEQIVTINALGPKSIFTTNDNFFCKEDDWLISITNQSEVTDNTVYEWVFGDSYLDTLFIEDPASFSYSNTGEHSITLITTDTVTGCSHETLNYIDIDNFNIHFLDTAEGGCGSLIYIGEVAYTDFYPIDVFALIYYWDFGNGFTGTLNPPDTNIIGMNYTDVGDYLVEVYATNNYGCSDTIYEWVNVYEPPIASFEINNIDQCPPFNAAIASTSIEGDTSLNSYEYLYAALDSSYYTVQNPTIPIEATGPYQIALTVSDINGCSNTIEEYYNPNIIQFSYNFPSFLCYNTEFLIEAELESDLPVTNYLWEFGDGTISTQETPSISFDVSEEDTLLNYLSVIDSLGCLHVDSFYIYIAHPDFSFEFVVDEAACPPLYSDFSMFSTDSIEFFTIDYGDGESNTVGSLADAENISHVYEFAGNFDVTFSVTDYFGCTSSIFVDSLVHVPGPWATFSISSNSGCPPVDISFEIIDGNEADQFLWIFGDGNTSFLENPTHTYVLSGVYTPILILQDTVNYATGDSIPCVVSIPGEDIIIDGPTLDFAIINDTLCYGSDTPIEIQNLTTTIPGFEIASYLWNFGDGGFSFDISPNTYIYDQSGTYPITLTVTTVNGCSFTLLGEDSVEVLTYPYIFTHFDFEASCPPMMVNFFSDSSLSELEIENYTWYFGDGANSTELNPSHLYESIGPYYPYVNLDYLDCNYDFSLNESIQTSPIPFAAIGSSPIITNNSISEVELSNQSVGEDEIEWWINGAFYSEQDAIYLSSYSENLEIYLIAKNDEGCSDTTWLSFSDVNWGLPNIITPNGDGINDYLEFNFDNFGTCIHLTIYNRWGSVIYDNPNYKNLWNGRNLNGEDVSDGTYFYTVDLCKEIRLSGYITVLN